MGGIYDVSWRYLGDVFRWIHWGYLGDILVISGGCLGDIRGINEGIHLSGIWEIYVGCTLQPKGPLDQSLIFVKIST